jgi:cyclopropane-fatty-acyl-phospholipid synthase
VSRSARLLERLTEAGARLRIEPPAGPPLRVGLAPEKARIRFATPAAFEALVRGDHLALAEAYLRCAVDVEGELSEALRVVEVLNLEATVLDKLSFALRYHLGNRRRFQRRSIAFHYDRPVDFFLPWFERWRSYSHGFYRRPDDDPAEAQARKFQHAIDALGLAPGMRVLDVGAGWGGFLEYAGLRGIEVHGITISEQQYRFLHQLVREQCLPCTVEKVDLDDFRPERPFDAVVFMGSLEHLPDYRRVTRRLSGALAPGGGVYADFCAQRESFQVGAFMQRYVWPGTARYVNVPRLLDAWLRAGLDVEELIDDTSSYAHTVRDWARRLERARGPLAGKFGEESVRSFLLYLWGAHHFLRTRRTLAYHLVARRGAPGATIRGQGG